MRARVLVGLAAPGAMPAGDVPDVEAIAVEDRAR